MERLFQWLDSFKNANMVRAAFGEPQREAGHTIIPVALVAQGFGGGAPGDGEVSPGSHDGDRGAGVSRPLAVISVGSEGVRVHEIVDSTAVSISGISLAALLALLLYRLLSGRLHLHGG